MVQRTVMDCWVLTRLVALCLVASLPWTIVHAQETAQAPGLETAFAPLSAPGPVAAPGPAGARGLAAPPSGSTASAPEAGVELGEDYAYGMGGQVVVELSRLSWPISKKF